MQISKNFDKNTTTHFAHSTYIESDVIHRLKLSRTGWTRQSRKMKQLSFYNDLLYKTIIH